MIKGISTILGVGLIVLWIAGISTVNASGWLTWLDGVAGVAALVFAGSLGPESSRSSLTGGCIGMAAALFVLWGAALIVGVVPWMTWWNFAFACTFLVLTAASGRDQNRFDNQMPFRRSA